MVSPTPSRRQFAAALSLRSSISPATVPALGHGGFAVFSREDGLQGGGRPFPVTGRRLGEHVAHEVHHAPLVFRVRQHRVDRGDESGAPVADHQSDAPQPAFDHASEELLPAGRVLAHALVDRDDLAPALRADADGDEDAHVLHVPCATCRPRTRTGTRIPTGVSATRRSPCRSS